MSKYYHGFVSDGGNSRVHLYLFSKEVTKVASFIQTILGLSLFYYSLCWLYSLIYYRYFNANWILSVLTVSNIIWNAINPILFSIAVFIITVTAMLQKNLSPGQVVWIAIAIPLLVIYFMYHEYMPSSEIALFVIVILGYILTRFFEKRTRKKSTPWEYSFRRLMFGFSIANLLLFVISGNLTGKRDSTRKTTKLQTVHIKGAERDSMYLLAITSDILFCVDYSLTGSVESTVNLVKADQVISITH